VAVFFYVPVATGLLAAIYSRLAAEPSVPAGA
jgi:hypothetical protein